MGSGSFYTESPIGDPLGGVVIACSAREDSSSTNLLFTERRTIDDVELRRPVADRPSR